MESEKAKERQLRELKPFKNNPEKLKEKVTVTGREPVTEEKGESIELAVKKARSSGISISDKTVKKAKKILEVAKENLS